MEISRDEEMPLKLLNVKHFFGSGTNGKRDNRGSRIVEPSGSRTSSEVELMENHSFCNSLFNDRGWSRTSSEVELMENP